MSLFGKGRPAALLFPLILVLSLAISRNEAKAQDETSAVLFTPIKAGSRYFFMADDGALYVRESLHGKSTRLLSAKSFSIVVPSPNGEYLAYGIPKAGFKGDTGAYEIQIFDVRKRVALERLRDSRISPYAWTKNNKGFFYSKRDPDDQRERVYYHTVEKTQADDVVIFSQMDQPAWRYDVRVSDDGQYAVFTISHSIDDHTRIYFIDLDNPGRPRTGAPTVRLVDHFFARYTFVDNGGPYFFLQTDRDAPAGKIVLANTLILRDESWQTVIPESADTLLYATTAGDEYIIAVSKRDDSVIARVYSPPDAREVQAEMRRRADSIRRERGGQQARERDNRGGRPMPDVPRESLGLRLRLTSELPVPEGGTIVAVTSVAHEAELFYTVRFPDGSTRAYFYNIKNRNHGIFDNKVGGE